MLTIHWLGAGLSSGPGIKRLAAAGHELILWNRTLSKATELVQGLGEHVRAETLDWNRLAELVQPSDVVVSMLPATLHPEVAQLCVRSESHFVSSSYISPEMQSLDKQTRSLGLCFVNECGLDPGIDHLMAHSLMNDYRQSASYDPAHAHYFRSYCGGLSLQKNDFRYKFSWSPLGVLKALTSAAKWIDEGEVRSADRPWHALSKQTLHLPGGNTERFEAYPNRDSTPYVNEYGFGGDCNLQQFVRGTLRYDGWSDAWNEIFQLVESTPAEQRDKILRAKSDVLWKWHRFDPGEPDRVVLVVDLEVRQDNQTIWHKVYSLDESGNDRGTAMARLVSLPASIAVESVVEGKAEAGVSGAPADSGTVERWLGQLATLGERMELLTIV